MAQNRMDSLHVAGPLTCQAFTPPASSIGNVAIPAGAGIASSKLKHQNIPIYADTHATTTAAFRRLIASPYGATATLLAVRARVSVAAVGDSTVTVDLLKNGTTILSSTILINAAATTNWVDDAGFVSSSLVDEDFLEVNVTISAGSGTLPKGLAIQVVVGEEDAD